MRGKLAILLFCITGVLTQAPAYQKSTSSGKGFADKKKKHQSAALNTARRLAFEGQVKELGAKLMSIRNNAGTGLAHLSSQRRKAAQSLQAISGNSLKISWSKKSGLPIFIKGDRLTAHAKTAAGSFTTEIAAAGGYDFLAANADLLKLDDPRQEFKVLESEMDSYGMPHVRYQQFYKGVEVWGQDVRVHFNQSGQLHAFNGRYIQTPRLLNMAAGLAQADAEEMARAAFGQVPDSVISRQVILPMEDGAVSLAWLIQVKKGYLENWRYFVDAHSGEILKRYNHIMSDGPVTGRGVDLLGQTRKIYAYQIDGDIALIDASKPMFNAAGSTFPSDAKGVIYTYDAKNADSLLYFVTTNNANQWQSPGGVSASANGALVYDFFRTVFNRQAIDNDGSTMNIIINFQENLNNAFWTGQYMIFGNGDGTNFSDLAASLDVTGHEMSHGVVERTANLVYENQPGALNESFADVFGALFEFWVKGEQNGNWLMGEDVTTPGIPGDALRNMADPGAANVAFGGQQPTKMSEYVQLQNTPETDNGGVHVNSGIPNRAFYLFATDPAVGLDKAGEVYYRALTLYLNRNSKFIDCRLAVVQAATDVFGAGSAGVAAANNAFDAVEIFDGTGTKDPDPLPTIPGDEQVAFIDASTGILKRYQPNSGTVSPLSSNVLFSRPAATDDGSLVLYVDGTNNLFAVNSDGSGEEQLTTDGGFSNISISPDGAFVAATSIYDEAVIYVFDLINGGGGPIQLYTPTTSDGDLTIGTIRYPDRIDWASDNNTIMYDALNIFVNATGDTTEFWDINLLDVGTRGITRLFPPQPDGINIGNPVFASNADHLMAFDYVDENNNVFVLGVNLNTGDVGQITNNGPSLGSPSFSADDSKIFYHYIDNAIVQIWAVDLLADRITGNADTDVKMIDNSYYPLAFVVGKRPTGVETDEATVPGEFVLHQNYPNPFNPTTQIRFEMPEQAYVQLTIFDINGRQVANLISENRSAGSHAVNWNGRDTTGRPVSSGVYFYRLNVTSQNGKVRHQTNKMTLLK